MLEKLTTGVTNMVVKAKHAGEKVLVRVYGAFTELLIDREAELANQLRLNAHGLAAPVVGLFANGFVYGYVEGTACTPAMVRDPAVFPLVAARCVLHCISGHARLFVFPPSSLVHTILPPLQAGAEPQDPDARGHGHSDHQRRVAAGLHVAYLARKGSVLFGAGVPLTGRRSCRSGTGARGLHPAGEASVCHGSPERCHAACRNSGSAAGEGRAGWA